MNVSRLLRQYPKIYLLCNIGIWFFIGMMLSSFFMLIPFLNNIKCLCDGVTLAGWLGMIGGFMGGIYILLNDSEDK